jgi:hypothetical protein
MHLKIFVHQAKADATAGLPTRSLIDLNGWVSSSPLGRQSAADQVRPQASLLSGLRTNTLPSKMFNRTTDPLRKVDYHLQVISSHLEIYSHFPPLSQIILRLPLASNSPN